MQIHHTVPDDRLHELAKERDKYRRIAENLLVMPHRALGQWARQDACIELNHPAKSERYGGCPCGKRPD